VVHCCDLSLCGDHEEALRTRGLDDRCDQLDAMCALACRMNGLDDRCDLLDAMCALAYRMNVLAYRMNVLAY
jgi:hypothetical protein